MSAVKILVTTDGSNLSDKAVDTAVGLAEQLGGSLVGMTVALKAAAEAGEKQAVAERLESISRKAAERQVPCETVVERAEAVADGVLACAARVDATYIVMASRGLGTFGALLLGSETQKVLSQADRPVLIVR